MTTVYSKPNIYFHLDHWNVDFCCRTLSIYTMQLKYLPTAMWFARKIWEVYYVQATH